MRVAGGLAKWRVWACLLMATVGCIENESENALQAVPSKTITQAPTAVSTSTLPATASLIPSASPPPVPTASATPHPEAITEATAGQVQLYRTLTGHRGPVWDVALSPDGAQVASASSDHTARLWDVDTGEVLHVLERHRAWVYTVGYSPDGAHVVTGGRDRTAQVWNASTGAHEYGLRTFGEAFEVAFSPDASHVAVASLYSARGQVWPFEAGTSWVALEGHETRLRSVAFSLDGRLVATGDEQGVIVLHEAATGAPLATLGSEESRRGRDAYGLAFLPDSESLVVAGGDGFMRMYDVASGEETLSWLAHAGGVWDVTVSPDGVVLASAGGDGTLGLWSPESGDRLATLVHGGVVRGVDFARDGTLLASGGDDGQVKLWRLASE